MIEHCYLKIMCGSNARKDRYGHPRSPMNWRTGIHRSCGLFNWVITLMEEVEYLLQWSSRLGGVGIQYHLRMIFYEEHRK
jgi:hypothetical protein